MNRKNLTAAVLAGLAGIAGIAGTAQAVNLNPDGLGQVLIYPYFTTNGGNQTILSVVNTTDSAKAVKVRFLEGFNSREVLDFNLYMSAYDVWTAALADDAGTPTLYTNDDSCTVPYLYGDFDGKQALLSLAYNDNSVFSSDGGPTGIERAAEGHFEMIEMGTLSGDSAEDATHVTKYLLDDDEEIIEESAYWEPGDCDQLVDNWTGAVGVGGEDGDWIDDRLMDIGRNSGGLFGGAAIVNSDNGTMYSYNAQAIQGFDKSDGNLHVLPGGSMPSLNDGDQYTAWVFFGVPSNEAVDFFYSGRSVDAVSAVFMHENIMNEYALDEALAASTEWVVTFPTKSFYVDEDLLSGISDDLWVPDGSDLECNSWVNGEEHPNPEQNTEPTPNPVTDIGWEGCSYINVGGYLVVGDAIEPFTEVFDGESCELAHLQVWDRSERTPSEDPRGGTIPPVVSPSIPDDCDPQTDVSCETQVPFEFCYEVNVMRFGDGVIFDTPEIEGSSLLLEVSVPYENGWGRIDLSTDVHHQDDQGLVGLPVTGFAAYEFENNFVDGADVKAFYGGLFGHKGNVRRQAEHDDRPSS